MSENDIESRIKQLEETVATIVESLKKLEVQKDPNTQRLKDSEPN